MTATRALARACVSKAKGLARSRDFLLRVGRVDKAHLIMVRRKSSTTRASRSALKGKKRTRGRASSRRASPSSHRRFRSARKQRAGEFPDPEIVALTKLIQDAQHEIDRTRRMLTGLQSQIATLQLSRNFSDPTDVIDGGPSIDLLDNLKEYMLNDQTQSHELGRQISALVLRIRELEERLRARSTQR